MFGCYFLLLLYIEFVNSWRLPLLDPIGARNYTLCLLLKIVNPVLEAAANNNLIRSLPPSKNHKRSHLAPMEAFARSLAGISLWLEQDGGDSFEERLRVRYRNLTLTGIANVFNETSPDFLNFTIHNQCVIELGHIALALHRAPRSIWANLPSKLQDKITQTLKYHRKFGIPPNNWHLYNAMVEAFLHKVKPTESKESYISISVRKFEGWYLGDGHYSDGQRFRLDYYNSIAIHPLLLEISSIYQNHFTVSYRSELLIRAQRYATQLEMLISPEGAFPFIGRSNVYRFAVLHVLSLLIVRNDLSVELKKRIGALRTAMTNMIYRIAETRPLFDEAGWLVEGVVGYQPERSDSYISRGSLYECTLGLIHVALARNSSFWLSDEQPWTQLRIWSGSRDIAVDRAID